MTSPKPSAAEEAFARWKDRAVNGQTATEADQYCLDHGLVDAEYIRNAERVAFAAARAATIKEVRKALPAAANIYGRRTPASQYNAVGWNNCLSTMSERLSSLERGP